MHLNTPAVGARFPLRGTKKPCETQRATANRNMVGVYPSRHSGYSNYNISQQRTGCQKKIPTPPKKCRRRRLRAKCGMAASANQVWMDTIDYCARL